jgi:hypothetical protein
VEPCKDSDYSIYDSLEPDDLTISISRIIDQIGTFFLVKKYLVVFVRNFELTVKLMQLYHEIIHMSEVSAGYKK